MRAVPLSYGCPLVTVHRFLYNETRGNRHVSPITSCSSITESAVLYMQHLLRQIPDSILHAGSQCPVSTLSATGTATDNQRFPLLIRRAHTGSDHHSKNLSDELPPLPYQMRSHILSTPIPAHPPAPAPTY